MNEDAIRKAVAEAKRFIAAASAAMADTYTFTSDGKAYTYMVSGKRSGACRRASMELTRALAEARRP